MTPPLASFPVPAESAVLPGLSMKPGVGVLSEADAGFTDVLELCAAPVVANLVANTDPLVAAVMSPTISPRSWRLDSAEAAEQTSSGPDDDGHDEVPAEILALAINPPPLAVPVVPADLPTGSPRRASSAFAESSRWDAVGNDVTRFPLQDQAVAEAPAEPAPAAVVDRADATEKIAAAMRAPLGRATVVDDAWPKNKFLNPDAYLDARPIKAHGTGRAKSPEDMPATPDPIPTEAAFTPTRAGGMSAEAIPFVAPTTAPTVSPAIAISPASAAGIDERREVYLSATDATAVVREVVELTHEIRLRERGSVEVKFDFQDATELSVRLAYRDGDVQATFRTDSDDLRAALGREWQGFVANVAREPGGHRVADPIFTGADAFTDSSFGHDADASPDGDAHDRWQASPPDESGFSARSFSPARSFLPHAPALGLRVSSDRLLHAFA